MMMVHKLPVKFSAPSNLCRVRVAQLEILLQAQASATDVQQLVQLILKGLVFLHVSRTFRVLQKCLFYSIQSFFCLLIVARKMFGK